VYFVSRRKGEHEGHGGDGGALLFEGVIYHLEVKKLRESMEGRGMERPAVFLGGWCRQIYGGCIFCYTEERRTRRFLRRFAFGGGDL